DDVSGPRRREGPSFLWVAVVIVVALAGCDGAVAEQARGAQEKTMLAQLPEHRGLAARYPGDKGVDSDSAVVLADDFESATTATLPHGNAAEQRTSRWDRGWGAKGGGAEGIADGVAPRSATSLSMCMPGGARWSLRRMARAVARSSKIWIAATIESFFATTSGMTRHSPGHSSIPPAKHFRE